MKPLLTLLIALALQSVAMGQQTTQHHFDLVISTIVLTTDGYLSPPPTSGNLSEDDLVYIRYINVPQYYDNQMIIREMNRMVMGLSDLQYAMTWEQGEVGISCAITYDKIPGRYIVMLYESRQSAIIVGLTPPL